MLSNHALARNRTDRQREACMSGRGINMLRRIHHRDHVHNDRVFSSEHHEHRRAGFLRSWGMPYACAPYQTQSSAGGARR